MSDVELLQVNKTEAIENKMEENIETRGIENENTRRKLNVYAGPKSSADVEVKASRIQEYYGEAMEEVGALDHPEILTLLQQKMEEELRFAKNEQKRFIGLSRDSKIFELDNELTKLGDLPQRIIDAAGAGKRWKVEEEAESDSLLKEQLKKYRELSCEKLKIETLNMLDKEFPGIEYRVFSESGSGDGAGDKEINLLIIEPGPDDDPERRRRVEIFKKFLELSDDNQVGLGEKFTAHSSKDFAYFNVVFAHRDKNGDKELSATIPDSKGYSDIYHNEIKFDLGGKLNGDGAYEEINWNDEGLPTATENFYSDLLYNGKYLDISDQDFAEKLSFHTVGQGGELSAEQEESIKKGELTKEMMLMEAQAQILVRKRENLLRQYDRFVKKYFSENGQLKKYPDWADDENKQGALNELLLGLIKKRNGGRRDKIFAYPDKPQSDMTIVELTNKPGVIRASRLISEDEMDGRRKVVEFVKEFIADFKGQKSDEYWGKFGEIEDDMFVR